MDMPQHVGRKAPWDPDAAPRRAGVSARTRAAVALAAIVVVAVTLPLQRWGAGHLFAQDFAQDAPPQAALQIGHVGVPGRLGTHIWAGRAVDYRGIMTGRTPFTTTAGRAGTLDLTGIDVPPEGLAAQWFDVTGQRPDAAEDDWAAWRPVGPAVPIADARAALRQPLRIPDGEGRWLLQVTAFWSGEGRGDVGWGWLFDVVPRAEVPERSYTGLFMSGFEASAFISGTARCPGDDDTWWLSAEPETGFFERYRAVIAAQSGVPAGYTDYTPVEVTFKARLSPPGAYGHLGAYRRAITATQLVAMSPTLRCGMDKPDPALATPWYDFACGANGGYDRRLRFTVANRGSQPYTRTLRVVARDADGGEVDRFDVAGPLAPGAAATVERVWARPLPPAHPVALAFDGIDRRADRFFSNNVVDIPQVTMTPPACPPVTPSATPDGGPSATPAPPGRRAFMPYAVRP